MSTKGGTIRTYDQIAQTYLECKRDRNAILGNLNGFARYLRPDGLVLDIGCGPGFDSELLRERGFRAVGIDLSSQMIRSGKGVYPSSFILADMELLPLSQGADGLWVNASLHHIQRDSIPATLGEFHRVLKPGGVLFIAVKDGVGERWEVTPYDETVSRWFTYWSTGQLRSAVTAAGFEIRDLNRNGMWIECYAVKPST